MTDRNVGGIEHGQFEQLRYQNGYPPAVKQGNPQDLLPFSGGKVPVFQGQGFQIPLEGGQRRAEVMRDMGHDLPPKMVGVAEVIDLPGDPVRHLRKGGSQLPDFIPFSRSPGSAKR